MSGFVRNYRLFPLLSGFVRFCPFAIHACFCRFVQNCTKLIVFMLKRGSGLQHRCIFVPNIAANTSRPVARQGLTVQNVTIDYYELSTGNKHYHTRMRSAAAADARRHRIPVIADGSTGMITGYNRHFRQRATNFMRLRSSIFWHHPERGISQAANRYTARSGAPVFKYRFETRCKSGT